MRDLSTIASLQQYATAVRPPETSARSSTSRAWYPPAVKWLVRALTYSSCWWYGYPWKVPRARDVNFYRPTSYILQYMPRSWFCSRTPERIIVVKQNHHRCVLCALCLCFLFCVAYNVPNAHPTIEHPLEQQASCEYIAKQQYPDSYLASFEIDEACLESVSRDDAASPLSSTRLRRML